MKNTIMANNASKTYAIVSNEDSSYLSSKNTEKSIFNETRYTKERGKQ